MIKSIYKIGLYSEKESDFFFFTKLCESINGLDITFRSLSIDTLLQIEKKFAETPIYIIDQSFFENESFQKTLAQIQKSNIPILCLLQDSSESSTKRALKYPCDFWL